MKNNWRRPTEAEIKAISNMKKASLGDSTKLKNWTIAFALYCVLVVGFYIFADSLRKLLSGLFIILGALAVILIIMHLVDYREKKDYRRVAAGKFLVCDAIVVSTRSIWLKGRSGGRAQYFIKLCLSGSDKSNDMELIEHLCSAAMFRSVSRGDHMLALRYDVELDNHPFRSFEYFNI